MTGKRGEEENGLSDPQKDVSRKRQKLDFRKGTLHFLNTYCVLNHRVSTLQKLSP